MAESKFKVLMLVGGSADERAEFRREVLDKGFEDISFVALGVDAAKEMLNCSLRERIDCVLDGEFSRSADRSDIIGLARKAGAWVVAFDLNKVNVPADRSKLTPEERRELRLAHAYDENPKLDEGFDEVNHVRRIDGHLKFMLFEKRVPMHEFVTDENGKKIEKKLGPEYYMIERPGSLGCLMSRAAFERIHGGINLIL